ncbi:hypothetical protein KAU33_00590 [Candidatus Dependentiae bacterium]|nr:hypothetical protein [Candidatus Dependentiae bacterium]
MPKKPFISIITGEKDWSNSELFRILLSRGVECQLVDILNKKVRFYDIFHISNVLVNRIFTDELVSKHYMVIKELASLIEVFNQLSFLVVNSSQSFFFEISRLRTFLQLMKFKILFPYFKVYEDNKTFDELKFPVVIKPNCSGKNFLTAIVDSKEEGEVFISENLSKLQHDNFFIIQNYINSPDRVIYRVKNFGEFKVVLQIPCDRISKREEAKILNDYPPELLDIAVRIFSATNNQLGSVDILKDSEGKYYLIDIDATSRFQETDIELYKFNPLEVYADFILKSFKNKSVKTFRND